MERAWHSISPTEALQEQGVEMQRGLSAEQVEERRAKYGINALEQAKRRSFAMMFFDQFKNFMVILLMFAAVVSAILGDITDSIIIACVILLNATLGAYQENKAEVSLAALAKMASPHAKVLRDGRVQICAAAELVPGDIVELETGDYVPADLRLVRATNLQLQESALTGESTPVEKELPALPEESALGDRKNMAYSSALVTYGRGTGVVVETGMQTQIGHIAGMLQNTETVKTPLQKRLEEIGKLLGIGAIVLCGIIFVLGLLQGQEWLSMFMISVSLAVAAIPEGLTAIVTVVLSIGVQRLSKRGAIIRRLPAVETLGSATVICSDKTGTLTQNRMTVTRAETEDLYELLQCAALCNDVHTDPEGALLGDPTETALVAFASQKGVQREALEEEMPREDEVPFDSERKRMSTVHPQEHGYRVFVKGATDQLLPLCTHRLRNGMLVELNDAERKKILAAVDSMGKDALRVLGFARKDIDAPVEKGKLEAYENRLVFLGMLGMIDPPREEVAQAVKVCKGASIRPVMITGDHAITASAIAQQLGILRPGDAVLTGEQLEKMDEEALKKAVLNTSVYARVSPEHKVRIVDAWQSHGDIVAMTGDGVNDAPALKKADIGVAMGITGTEVSKEAASMILTDDNFATIVNAVEEGRTIYANITKTIQYLLSCNIGEVFVVFVCTLLAWGSPLRSIHLLWVNLVTDTLPALALGVEPREPGIMTRPPRDPRLPFFSRSFIVRLLSEGVMVGLMALFAYRVGLSTSVEVGQSMAFLTLALSQLVHSFNMRSPEKSLFTLGFFTNAKLIQAFVVSAVLQLGVFVIPPVRELFSVVAMNAQQWLIALGLALVPLPVMEISKWVHGMGERKEKAVERR